MLGETTCDPPTFTRRSENQRTGNTPANKRCLSLTTGGFLNNSLLLSCTRGLNTSFNTLFCVNTPLYRTNPFHTQFFPVYAPNTGV